MIRKALRIIGQTYYHRVGETWVEFYNAFNIFDVFVGQDNAESLNVRKKMLHFATTDDRENICRLLHQVCDRHWWFVNKYPLIR